MLREILKTTLLFTLIFLFGCNNAKETNNTYLITFDDIAGYLSTPNNSLLVTNLAHSGNTCAYVYKDLLYGATYKRSLKDLSPKQINKITLKAWVRKDVENANLKLVCSINKGEETIFWNAIETKSQSLVNGEWKEISYTFDISKVNSPENNVIIYPLNDGVSKIMLDDLSINVE
jgi:hypothetical protein